MAYNPTHPDWCGCYDCRLFARAEEIIRDRQDSDGGWEPYDVDSDGHLTWRSAS